MAKMPVIESQTASEISGFTQDELNAIA